MTFIYEERIKNLDSTKFDLSDDLKAYNTKILQDLTDNQLFDLSLIYEGITLPERYRLAKSLNSTYDEGYLDANLIKANPSDISDDLKIYFELWTECKYRKETSDVTSRKNSEKVKRNNDYAKLVDDFKRFEKEKFARQVSKILKG